MHFVQILLAAVLAALINAAAPVLRPYVVGAATSTARRLSPFWRGFLVGAAAALVVVGGFASLGGLPSIAWPDWSFPSIVTPSGPRQILLVYESSDTTPELARAITALRVGPAAEYLQSKGHTLDVLDVDAVDGQGNPSPRVAQWRETFGHLKLPAILVIAPPNKVVHASSIDEPSATAILDVIKAKE